MSTDQPKSEWREIRKVHPMSMSGVHVEITDGKVTRHVPLAYIDQLRRETVDKFEKWTETTPTVSEHKKYIIKTGKFTGCYIHIPTSILPQFVQEAKKELLDEVIALLEKHLENAGKCSYEVNDCDNCWCMYCVRKSTLNIVKEIRAKTLGEK